MQLSFCLEGKAWEKHRSHFSCCSKLASKQRVQLSFCLELLSLVKQPDKIFSLFDLISKKLWFAVLDKTCKKQRARKCYCSKLASSHNVQLSFCFKLVRIVRKLTPVRNCARNCPVNQNWCHLLKSQNLSKTPRAIVLLLKIGVKRLCATVVSLQIGRYC